MMLQKTQGRQRCRCPCNNQTGPRDAYQVRCLAMTDSPDGLCDACAGGECVCPCWGGPVTRQKSKRSLMHSFGSQGARNEKSKCKPCSKKFGEKNEITSENLASMSLPTSRAMVLQCQALLLPEKNVVQGVVNAVHDDQMSPATIRIFHFICARFLARFIGMWREVVWRKRNLRAITDWLISSGVGFPIESPE